MKKYNNFAIGLLCLFHFLSLAFASPNRTICGSDDMVSILEEPSFIQEMSGPIGITGGCTGTLITVDLFITARHCKPRPGKVVKFGYLRNEEEEFEMIELIEKGPDGAAGDYAIVRLAG